MEESKPEASSPLKRICCPIVPSPRSKSNALSDLFHTMPLLSPVNVTSPLVITLPLASSVIVVGTYVDPLNLFNEPVVLPVVFVSVSWSYVAVNPVKLEPSPKKRAAVTSPVDTVLPVILTSLPTVSVFSTVTSELNVALGTTVIALESVVSTVLTFNCPLTVTLPLASSVIAVGT